MTISPIEFLEDLVKRGVGFFAGVPDSLLRNLCDTIATVVQPENHLITANEGNAVAVALGYHLATGKLAAVYMQNSGLGNAINPLTSLMDSEVYRVPVLLVIGWRGEPGTPDEPQHIKQGRITPKQLELLGIPYWILEANSEYSMVLKELFVTLERVNSPVALLVRKGAFSQGIKPARLQRSAILMREEALERLLTLADDALVVSTTGKTSREVYELREARKEPQRDFLTVGGMGHAASIALGVSTGCSQQGRARRVVCLDGDGAALMHLGALAIIGQTKPTNFIHVLLNNSAHESVGGQPTVVDRIDLKALAIACGYRSYMQARDVPGIDRCWLELNTAPGPVFFQIDIAIGSRSNLGRPASTPEQNKVAFMKAAR